MSRLPSVTVIVLNYNGYKLTVNCIKTVLKSDYTNFNILIVDNGSTDDSYIKLKSKYKNCKKIKVIPLKDNLSFTGGFNFGAIHARGDKIILLSNDITVDRYWIKELIAVAKNNSKYLVQPKILCYKNKKIIDNVGGKYSRLGLGVGIGSGEIDRGQYDQNRKLDYTSATTLMIDRKFFLKIGGYDEWFCSHSEDVDLSLRVKKNGGECILCYKSQIYHIGSPTYKKYVNHLVTLFHIRKNRIRVVMKNYNGVEKLLRLSIIMLQHIALIVEDFSTLKKERMFLTIRSTYTAFFN